MVRKVMNPTVSRDPTASGVPSVTYMANGLRLDQSARGFFAKVWSSVNGQSQISVSISVNIDAK